MEVLFTANNVYYIHNIYMMDTTNNILMHLLSQTLELKHKVCPEGGARGQVMGVIKIEMVHPSRINLHQIMIFFV